jgi:hypothetical protein
VLGEQGRPVGRVYRGRRLLRPWWRQRLALAALLGGLVVVGSVLLGLGLGWFLLAVVGEAN